jgi:uncharacterized protein (TIGR02145 family)
MRYLLTLLLAALSLNAIGQTNQNYNPDYDADNNIGINDLLGFLSIFGDGWDYEDVINGCTYPESLEYNPFANDDDGSCTFPIDCNGVLNGTSLVDGCGVCDSNTSNDCIQDCNGEWGGIAQLDECGVCDEDPVNDCCGGISTHEGYNYSTVQIGDQCWFSENVRYLPVLSPYSVGVEDEGLEGDPVAYVNGYYQGEIIVSPDSALLSSTNYDHMGALYNYNAIEQWNLCPSNWHISTYGDWELLISSLGGPESAAHALKDTLFYPATSSQDFNGDNSSGFSSFATGHRNAGGSGMLSLHSYAFYWTQYESWMNNYYSAHRAIREDVFHSNFGGSVNGMAVRCVKDFTDECGVLNGDNSTCVDECGVPNGDNSTCFTGCGDLVSHDNYDYSTVQIGEQCWFSENCRYLPEVSPSSASSTTEPYYYVGGYEGTDVAIALEADNYDTYGVLYNWPAVMTVGICPSGWHIPSDVEFTQLSIFLGGESVAGGKIKEAGYDHWNSPNEGATNSSGFNGLPGGTLFGGFSGLGHSFYMWSSSSEIVNNGSWSYRLSSFNTNFIRSNMYVPQGFSARCIKD